MHPLALARFDKGEVMPELTLGDLVLVLRRSPQQQKEFDAFVASQYDANSKNYHRWLTPEQIYTQFGPSPSDIQAISNWLADHGLTVDEVAADGMTIRFSGSAAQVEEAFHTPIHTLEVKGERHVANMADPQIPAALGPVVVGVKALHNFFAKPMHRMGAAVTRDAEAGGWRRVGGEVAKSDLAGRVKPQFGTADAYGDVVEDVAPYDFAKIYNVLPEWTAASPIDGSQQTIAIAGTSNINLPDVAAFRSAFGLPAKAPSVLITNSDPGACPGFAASCADDLVENTLDVEWSGAVAKGANIVLVTSSAPTTTSDPLFLSEQYIVQHKTASIMNVSYGSCELQLGTAGNAEYNNLWQTAAAEGIAVFVASGDAGSPACDQGFDAIYGIPYPAQFGLAVNGIASTPYDTSVGGTDLNWGSTAAPYWSAANGTGLSSAVGYIPEVPWNSSCVNPLILPALATDAAYIGVSGVVDAESACNFVIESGAYIQTNFGVNLAPLVDTIGGGGGASNCTVSGSANPEACGGYYAKPSWQAGVTGIPADGARDVPDLSFFASNGFLGSSYLICVAEAGSACTYSAAAEPTAQEVGGTSVASPAMAGVMALINQRSGSSQGNPNTVLYELAARQSYSNCSAETVKATSTSCVFNDIDTGTNAMACVNPAIQESPNCAVIYAGDPAGILTGFSAGVGYDQATGLGSLNVANAVNSWPSIAPYAGFSTTSLTFAATSVGYASASQVVTLKNTGNAALSLSGTGISIAGTNASSFSQTNTCGTGLAVGASCTATVVFKPAAIGALTASLSFADNAFGSPQLVALSGTGVAPAPVAKLSAQSLSFNSTAVGSTNTAPSIMLTNSGTAALAITSIAFAGTNASSFTETNTCGTSLAIGASCGIVISFKPTVAGTLTATLDVNDNEAGSPQTLALSGVATGGTPAVSLSPTTLTFASTAVGTAAATQAVTLKNSGTAALSLSGTGLGITVTGTNATSFTQTNTCGTSVAAGVSCAITVTFKPTAAGALTAAVNIADNATGSPQEVNLTGTGTATGAEARLSVTALTFASTNVGTAAATQTITLGNPGTAALTFGAPAISIAGTGSTSFTQTNNCGATVAAGKNCVITVTFKPTLSGTLTATLSISDNATGSPQTVTLTGTGSGAVPAVSLSATALTFGSTAVGTAAATQAVTVKNSGTAALSLSGTGLGITVTGTNASSFTQTNTCGTSVAAGVSCVITVTFKPTATGALTAAVSIADNATGSPQTVTLTGTGATAGAEARLSVTSLTFASTAVGTAAATQPITLGNPGGAALTLGTPAISIAGTGATSFTETNNCGTTVAAGKNCNIIVTFKPVSAGSLTATLSIADNVTGSPQTVTLTGTGN
jgi:subtilase family serine protease